MEQRWTEEKKEKQVSGWRRGNGEKKVVKLDQMKSSYDAELWKNNHKSERRRLCAGMYLNKSKDHL